MNRALSGAYVLRVYGYACVWAWRVAERSQGYQPGGARSKMHVATLCLHRHIRLAELQH